VPFPTSPWWRLRHQSMWPFSHCTLVKSRAAVHQNGTWTARGSFPGTAAASRAGMIRCESDEISGGCPAGVGGATRLFTGPCHSCNTARESSNYACGKRRSRLPACSPRLM
jgi:hypothetical protein